MVQRVHLIIHTDSTKKSDVATFRNAALTLKKDYQRHYPADAVQVEMVHTGRELVEKMNAMPDGSIASLDICSHGNQGGIHISRKLAKPVPSGLIQSWAHVKIRENSDRPQSAEDAKMIEESIHGLYSDRMARKAVSYYYNQTHKMKEADNGEKVDNEDTAYISHIDADKFAKDGVFVEFHGCRTAEHVAVFNDYLKENFACNFSEKIGTRGIVLGHIFNAAPDKNPNGNRDDYRYGKIRSYVNGKLNHDHVERFGLRIPHSSTPA